MTFPGYPLRTDLTNNTPAHDTHPAVHNDANAAINDLQDQVTAGGGGGGGDADTLEGSTKAQILDRANHTGTQSADSVIDGSTNHAFTAADDTKLTGIATAATANSADATLLARANHTGTQAMSTVTETSTGKILTDVERTKLTGIATGATANSSDATLLARTNHTGTQSADTLTDGTTNKAFLATERTKLTGIATSATANSADATLLARANHTGTQSADTLTDGTTNKAFLATERTKLTGVATSATANDTDANLKARANHTGTQLYTTISDFDAGWEARRRARNIDIKWETGDATSKLGTTIVMTDSLSDSSTDWTRTIIQQGVPPLAQASLGTAALKLSCPTGLSGGNSRYFFPITGSDSINARMSVVVISATAGAQVGLFFRERIRTSSSNPWAYTATNDVAFGVQSLWNLNTWENDVAGNTLILGTGNGSGGMDLPGLQRWTHILSSSKDGTAVTLEVPYGHGTIVGDSLAVLTQELGQATVPEDNIVTVTAIGENWVQYTSAVTGKVRDGGIGRYMNRTIFPIKIEAELIGAVLKMRAWRIGDGRGMPDWSNFNYAHAFTNTGVGPGTTEVGVCGLIVDHLANDTKNVVIGSLTWGTLD